MNVAIFGLGYVGTVTAASLAAAGHRVLGVDVNAEKVNAINDGRSPVVEPGLEELIRSGVASGALSASGDLHRAVAESAVSMICVGTPSRRNGSLDLTHLTRVSEQIGCALRRLPDASHLVVVRSTVLPGTVHTVVIPALERTSGRRFGDGFGVSVNPEFLREGSAVDDFRSPPYTLIGHNHPADATGTLELYESITAPIVCTSIRVAEMVKYTSNAWHALKVCFANEIGSLCRQLDIDSHEMMDIFCCDEKLNLSRKYLKPGFAFGGSCLPKDLRAVQYRAKELDLELPVMQSILPSNRLHLQRALDEIVATGRKRIGLLGFSFKAGTDDLRESPMVLLAESLLGKGYELAIYDRNVSLARLVGANKEYIEQQIPHLSSLLRGSWIEIVEFADVVVVGTPEPEFAAVIATCRADQIVIDLVRIPGDLAFVKADYRGLCW